MASRSVRAAAGAGALAAAVALAGCGSGDAAQEPDAEGLRELRVAVSTMSSVAHGAPFYVGGDPEVGIFEKHGIRMVATEYPGGAPITRAVLSGEEKLGVGGFSGVALAVQGGEPLKVLVEVPFELYYIAPDGKDYASLEDLKGRKIHYTSQGGGGHTAILSALDKIGFDPEDDVTLVQIDGLGGGWAAAKTGVVDVSLATDPFGASMVSEEGAKKVFSLDDYTDIPHNAYFATEKVIAEDAELLRDFFAAYDEVVDWMEENTDRAAEIYAEAIGVNAEVARTTIAENPFRVKKTSPEGLRTLEDTMLAFGLAKEPIDWESVFDASVLGDEFRIDLG